VTLPSAVVAHTLAEWRTLLLPGTTLSEPDRRLADTLRAGEPRLQVDELREGVRVTSRSWVGVVRFDGFELHIVPKVTGGNLGVLRMLEYASGLSALSRLESERTLDIAKAGSLVDLLALLLAEASARLVRDGLLSDYVTREETLTSMRGRLRLDTQLRRRFGQVDQLECRFDELETDIVENRLLAAGLAVARRVCTDPEVRRKVIRQHLILSEVCDADAFDPQSAELELAYHRRNEHYRAAHDVAWMFVRALAVNDLYAPGSMGSFAFLLDMNKLFEDFVTRLLMDASAGTGINVQAQHRDRRLIVEEPLQRPYAAVIPDILLETIDAAGRRRVPVDAKYKLYDEGKLDPGDVYQTFFYAYAYARPIDRGLDRVRAFILYPASGGGSGTRLRVLQESGATTARIQAIPIDIPAALRAVAQGRVRDLSALHPLLEGGALATKDAA